MTNEMFRKAESLKELKERKVEIDAQLKEVNVAISQTEEELSGMMLDTETQSFNRSGTLFYLNTKTYASAKADRKEDLFQALKNNGFASLVVETVNSNSLAAFVREQMTENEDNLPEWLDGKVNVFEKTTVGVRKAK
jgi:hypothetical protein